MKKNITAAIVAIAIVLLHTGFVFKPVAFTCAHTIPSTFYCGVGDQLKLVFDNISSPASGNVHLGYLFKTPAGKNNKHSHS